MNTETRQYQGRERWKKVRFKKVRKNKPKGKSKFNRIRVLYANVNGIGDKTGSLLTAAQLYKAHIIAITETKQIPPKIEGYGNWKSKERKNKGGGGVAITARNDIYQRISMVVDIEDEDMDVVWVEVRKNQKEKLYIGTYYGKQENEKREEIEREYEQLNTQINIFKAKGEVILTGDFNSKLKISIRGEEQHQSANGIHLQRLIENNNLEPVSIKPEYVDYTRQNRNNINEKSVIDYVVSTPSIAHNFKEIITDTKGVYRIKGRKESDHNTILMEVEMNLAKEKKKK